MTSISFSQNGLTPFQQLLGHSKGILEKRVSLEDCIYSDDTFSAELREQVRRTLAFHNSCEYCMVEGAPSKNKTGLRVRSTIRAADLSSSRTHIGDDEIDALKETLTDSEITEFSALVYFIMVCRRFGALLGLEADCQIRMIGAPSARNPEAQFVDGDPILL